MVYLSSLVMRGQWGTQDGHIMIVLVKLHHCVNGLLHILEIIYIEDFH